MLRVGNFCEQHRRRNLRQAVSETHQNTAAHKGTYRVRRGLNNSACNHDHAANYDWYLAAKVVTEDRPIENEKPVVPPFQADIELTREEWRPRYRSDTTRQEDRAGSPRGGRNNLAIVERPGQRSRTIWAGLVTFWSRWDNMSRGGIPIVSGSSRGNAEDEGIEI